MDKTLLLALLIVFYAGNQSLKAQNKLPKSVFFGVEIYELSQNSFKNLGPDNYTFFAGTTFEIDSVTSWGLRYTGMNVELSEKHLQDPSPAYKGDFTGVTGNLNVQRLHLDYYYTWNFKRIKIQPIMSVGIGYNNWKFYNKLIDENYDLKTASIGIGGKFRFTFFEYAFVEIPAIDGFFHVYKNRKPEQYLGDAHIAFNDYFAVFNWLFIGCSIPLN